ncbi:hypothetical protein [Paenibacillus gansuensis]|uniref:Nicotinamidase n=1 Tax=Paenibacillus gansuensis TaxID=306542 RepID=A0ABW5PK84_9BACL
MNSLRTPFEAIVQVDAIAKHNAFSLNEIVEAARTEQLPPAKEDQNQTLLLIIDPQYDFMETGALPVPGSIGDVERLTRFLYRNLHKVTQVALTKDVHTLVQIFHPAWWKDAQGKSPEPVTTVIHLDDVRQGKWIPQFEQEQSIRYLETLEKYGKKELRIWPYHCIEGTRGAELEQQLMNLVMFHAAARGTNPVILEKGKEAASEMYGAFYQEDGTVHDKNQIFLEQLAMYDKIYIAGEAKSHCVLESVEQIVRHYANDRSVTEKLYVLDDCMSPIPGSEQAVETALQQLSQSYGIHIIDSTDIHL